MRAPVGRLECSSAIRCEQGPWRLHRLPKCPLPRQMTTTLSPHSYARLSNRPTRPSLSGGKNVSAHPSLFGSGAKAQTPTMVPQKPPTRAKRVVAVVAHDLTASVGAFIIAFARRFHRLALSSGPSSCGLVLRPRRSARVVRVENPESAQCHRLRPTRSQSGSA